METRTRAKQEVEALGPERVEVEVAAYCGIPAGCVFRDGTS